MQRLNQDIMMQKIKVLVPNAKLSARPHNKNDHLAKNPVIRGSMLIDWNESNTVDCPSLAEIEAVTVEQVEAMEQTEIKSARNKQLADNLPIKALFKMEKAKNHELQFSDYLDQLESEIV